MRAAKIALRSVARRAQELADEIDWLAEELDDLVALAAPNTIGRLGLGTQNTAALLVAAGENIDRFRSEAAFAHLCGVARRIQEGKAKAEVIRCLKRYLVREVFRTLRADLGTLAART